MGEVYRGWDDVLERVVAVKALRSSRRLRREVKARFLREARILSRLDHPGICRIHDLVEDGDTDYLILEHIEGRTLRELGNLGPDETLRIARDVCLALAAAHRENVVHRDLKPDNVMVTGSGEVKVLDFGIARSLSRVTSHGREAPDGDGRSLEEPAPGPRDAIDETTTGTTVSIGTESLAQHADSLWDEAREVQSHGMATITRHGSILGTVRYMSPEQAAGRHATPASDMYSLGIMLQELLTGKPAYDLGFEGIDLLHQVSRAESIAPVGIALEMAELVAELKRFDPGARPSAAETAQRIQRYRDKPRRVRRRRWRLAVGAAFAVVVVVSGLETLNARLRANRSTRIAESFARTASEIEWSMRVEHMCAAHDISEAERAVRVRMAELEAQMATLGPIAAGPGHAALGRGYMALGELDAARAELEQAVELLAEPSDVHATLGVVLAQLYHRELRLLRSFRVGGAKERQRRELEHDLRDEAVRHLQLAPAPRDGNGSLYCRARLAAAQSQYDQAVALARQTLEAQPWRYEAQMLLGEVAAAESIEAANSGDHETATRLNEKAVEEYRLAVAIAGSDPGSREAICNIHVNQANMNLNTTGADLQPALIAATSACSEALAIDPAAVEPLVLLIRRHHLDALAILRRGGDPRPELQAAINVAHRAQALEPDNRRILSDLAIALQVKAQDENARGVDPSTTLREAIDLLERVVEMSPSSIQLNNLGLCYTYLGSASLNLDADPTAALENAERSFVRAIQLDPDSSLIHHNRGLALQIRGQWQADHGHDPITTYDRAGEAFAAAIALNPRQAASLSVLGVTRVLEAENELGRGIDPVPHLDQARESLEAALAINPNDAMTRMHLGSAHVIRARALMFSGQDPRASHAAAHAEYELALSLNPRAAFVLANLLVVLRDEAHWALLAGRDLKPMVHDAEVVLERAVAINPQIVNLYELAAGVHIWQARAVLAGGQSPDRSLARARHHLSRCFEISESYPAGHLAAAEAEIIAAGARVEHGLDPTIELGRARTHMALTANPDVGPDELCLAAELELVEARWEALSGVSSDRALANGLELATLALAANPRRAEAEVLRARLYDLARRQASEPSARAEALRRARTSLAGANELNPMLEATTRDLAMALVE